jgi:diguanylate cyclase (GGDEF)-like protein
VVSGEIGTRGYGPVMQRIAVLSVLVLAAAIALLWLVGRSLDRNRTTASNSQLVADIQVARATLESDVSVATRKASALAHMARVEQALDSGDAAALAAITSTHPDTQLISARGARAGSLAPLGVRRILEVSSAGRTIGRVVTDAPLDDSFLARAREDLSPGSHDLLALTLNGRAVVGPLPSGTIVRAAAPVDLHAQGHTYRALASELVAGRPGLRVVALAPSSSSSAWRLPLAVLATLLGLGVLVVFALGLWRRQERRRPVRHVVPEPRTETEEQPAPGMSVSMLGEQLAAAKDVDALLRVILDAAIKATGAAGGKVVRPGDPAATPSGSEREVLRVPLNTNEPEGDSTLLLYPPASGFSAEAADVAHWLGAHAGIAIRDARFHRVAQEQPATDALTGLANRAQFTAALGREFARAESESLPLSVVLADLDDFKAVNDRLGFRVGDEVLKAYGETLQRGVRGIDLAARIGGQQFAVVLPETETEGARQFAERLRTEFRAVEGMPIVVTASYGVGSYPHSRSAEELLAGADACLHKAKQSGKDRVVTADNSVPEPAPRA